MANPDQCALAADGSLLDAADITFYDDPDDDAPIPSLTASSKASSSTLHPIFQAKKIAGSRRSVRITRPSARIIDPDNAEALVTTRKRSATVTASAIEASRTARRPKLTSSESDGGESERDGPERVETTGSSGVEDDIAMDGVSTGEDDEGSSQAEDGELAQESQDALAYRATKAMGDTDRQVCCLSSISLPVTHPHRDCHSS
jgi:hypothetical protein